MSARWVKGGAAMLLFVCAGAAHADDCDFDVRRAQPLFDPPKTAFKGTAFERHLEKYFVEDVTILKDGTRVTVRRGGCAHLTTAYHFESKALRASFARPRELLARLIADIKALPFTAKFKDEGQWVSAELEGWANLPSQFEVEKSYSFQCQKPDFVCALTIVSPTTVSVSKTF